MKTSELTGALLDLWVGKAEGHDVEIFMRQGISSIFDPVQAPYDVCLKAGLNGGPREDYAPSTSWAQGGPIMEREKIGTGRHPLIGAWVACGQIGTHERIPNATGSTPLIAAMRAYVVSKYGKEVPEVPA